MEAQATVIKLESVTNESLRIQIERMLLAQAEISFEAGMRNALQGIGEALCIQVGNTMLSDMGAGKLLGEQLREVVDFCRERRN